MGVPIARFRSAAQIPISSGRCGVPGPGESTTRVKCRDARAGASRAQAASSAATAAALDEEVGSRESTDDVVDRAPEKWSFRITTGGTPFVSVRR